MDKSPEAFRTISEVAEALDTPSHVLRFWESRFPQIRPVKRAGGRRYYRPADVALLTGIRLLLHEQGLTIRGVQKILREQGVRHVAGLAGDHDGVVFIDDTADEIPVADMVTEVVETATILPLRRPVTEAEGNAVPKLPETIPEAAQVWIEAEPQLALALPEPAVEATMPAPAEPTAKPGLANRIRVLRRPLSATARAELTELHSRLGLLHAQMAEAVRLRR